MTVFAVKSQTNYGEVIYLVNALTKETAIGYAEKAGAWDNSEAEEVDTSKFGVVFIGGGE